MSNKRITASELQNHAMRLSNNSFVSHWLHFNYPEEAPWLMAIECRDRYKLKPVKVADLVREGYTWNAEDGRHYIERDFKKQ